MLLVLVLVLVLLLLLFHICSCSIFLFLCFNPACVFVSRSHELGRESSRPTYVVPKELDRNLHPRAPSFCSCFLFVFAGLPHREEVVRQGLAGCFFPLSLNQK